MFLDEQNLHWTAGRTYGYPLKRTLYSSILEGMDRHWITIVTGLRRTGKTTLLKQMIDALIQSGTKRENILFYSFDEGTTDVRGVLTEFQKRIGSRFHVSDEHFYIFLDEVQKCRPWSSQVKIFYDTYKNLKFVISGSASLFIRRESVESLAGRTQEYYLPRLSFREYLRFKGIEKIADDPQFHAESLAHEFEAYLPRQFIETVNLDMSLVKQHARTLAEKVIFTDIPSAHPIDEVNALLEIVKIVAANPGMLMDYTTLADTLGINRVTASNYVYYLSEAFLLNLGYNYSKNINVRVRKHRKAYLANPAFADLYSHDIRTPISKFVEWHFFTEPVHGFFWRTHQKDEVDIVMTEGYMDVPPLPVEVKYVEEVTSSDMKGLRKFMRTFDVKDGVLVTKHAEGTLTVDEGKIRQVPAWKAALDPSIIRYKKGQ